MGDSEGMRANADHGTAAGEVPGGVHAQRGERVPIERIEWMAERVGGLLRQSLPADKQVQAELRAVIAELAARQAQVAEWVAYHHLLHEVLLAFSPFHARLASVGQDSFDAAELQTLLQNWRLCQDMVDRLVDFAEGVDHIGSPFRREGRELRGERWAVDVVAMQLLFEDILKEDRPSPEGLRELASEFNSLCHRHLALADRELHAAVDELRRLSRCLLGEMA
jgi:hypothetical protein